MKDLKGSEKQDGSIFAGPNAGDPARQSRREAGDDFA
jgi:hypothetical protein